MSAPDISQILAAARRHQPAGHRLRRVVLRLHPNDIVRLDALRRGWPKTSRAALVRVLVLLALASIEAPKAPAATPEAAP